MPSRLQHLDMMKSTTLVFCLVYVWMASAHAVGDLDRRDAQRLHRKLTENRVTIMDLRKSLRDIEADITGSRNSYQDTNRKRKTLELVNRILSEIDVDLLKQQKRTCNVNLGGHCATESAADVANQWHYLNSAISPGRKRRDTRHYSKVPASQELRQKRDERQVDRD
ncbi:hypothetical protein LSAT2_032404 [Lamellibrachia satsuma]|nr:hypothetical protein LSAT2_032404 [Lamellibrachia satsuma]